MTEDDAGDFAVILADYAAARPQLDDFSVRFRNLLSLVLKPDVKIHSITSRVKTEASLQGKLARKPERYQSLTDVTDIVGVRVITFFASDVDKVGELIQSEFLVDTENSVDKRSEVGESEFGYLSLHYVVRVGSSRRNLPEWKKDAKIPVEIQVRSILQHAWAEIEHDLGYKTEAAVPRGLRRRFSRLAGLFELADQEFDSLRADVSAYRGEIEAAVESPDSNPTIDADSMAAVLRISQSLRAADDALSQAAGVTISGSYEPDPENEHIRQSIAKEAQLVGLVQVRDLEMELSANKDLIAEFAKRWLSKRGRSDEFPVAISVFYLAYARVARLGSVDLVERYLKEAKISVRNRRSVGEKVLTTYQLASAATHEYVTYEDLRQSRRADS